MASKDLRMRDAIDAASLDRVTALLRETPALLNQKYDAGLTPLIHACWERDLTMDAGRIANLNAIAMFLLSQPGIDVKAFRAGSPSNRACYYCGGMNEEVVREINRKDKLCRKSKSKTKSNSSRSPKKASTLKRKSSDNWVNLELNLEGGSRKRRG